MNKNKKEEIKVNKHTKGKTFFLVDILCKYVSRE